METENSNGKRKRNISPETRQKLSELAKKRHAEGKFGGPKFGKLGGRPKKVDRVSKRVAEAAQEDANARRIIEVFKDAIHPSQPMRVRLKAAETWLGVEREEAKVALQEADSEAKQHSREELIGLLTERLTSGPAATILRRQIEQENIVDAEIVEEDGA